VRTSNARSKEKGKERWNLVRSNESAQGERDFKGFCTQVKKTNPSSFDQRSRSGGKEGSLGGGEKQHRETK